MLFFFHLNIHSTRQWHQNGTHSIEAPWRLLLPTIDRLKLLSSSHAIAIDGKSSYTHDLAPVAQVLMVPHYDQAHSTGTTVSIPATLFSFPSILDLSRLLAAGKVLAWQKVFAPLVFGPN